jgi:hypothetical protein
MPKYDTAILKQKAIDAIEKNKLIFVEDICAYIGVSKPCFYDHFRPDSNDFNELSEMLEKNKIALKVGMRKKWYDSENATMQMALYKLCSTAEEHKKLQQNYVDHTTKDEAINRVDLLFPPIDEICRED